MAIQPSVKYVKVGASMVAKPVNVRLSGAWHPVQAVPGVPTNVVASANVASVELGWAEPANTGGIPVTDYTITASPGGATTSTSSTSTSFNGLTNGTTYTFTVKATNAVGIGSNSTASNSVTPSASITGKIYLAPASGPYNIGDTVVITVREDSIATPINSVQANITYPASMLQYVSTNINATTFPAGFPPSQTSGSVTIPAGTLSTDPTGDQAVADVTFTVIAAGTANVTITNTSALYRSSDSANILNSTAGASFTLT